VKKITIFIATMFISISLLNIKVKAQNTVDISEQNTMSVLWFQKSGEAKALYYQGYNIGKLRLDQALAKKPKNPAVVLDIDETIVDNSPLFAANLDPTNSFSWEEWIMTKKAKPLPGAIDFLKYANKRGVDIYYISNRKEAMKEATIKNLKQIGAPQVDEKHVLLMRPNEKGKEIRRQSVAATHQIVLFFGDNLNDFSGFEELSVSGRMNAVDRRKTEFGKKLIVFPNPMYGDWEEAIYQYDNSKSDADKVKLRKESLEKFKP
jgi:5'-nucleotidase (lipoprotein e(P4) family)